jgi:hypothetical protein
MAMKKPKPLATWRIILLRKRGQVLGRIQAPDAESAIKIAAEEIKVAEALQSRLVAQRVPD